MATKSTAWQGNSSVKTKVNAKAIANNANAKLKKKKSKVPRNLRFEENLEIAIDALLGDDDEENANANADDNDDGTNPYKPDRQVRCFGVWLFRIWDLGLDLAAAFGLAL